MSKKNTSYVKSFFIFLSAIILSSCSNTIPKTGSASFTIPKQAFRTILQNEYEEGGRIDTDIEEFSIKVWLQGRGYEDFVPKVITESELNSDEPLTVDFENIPLGTTVSARAEISSVIDGTEIPIYKGESDFVTISKGNNELSLILKAVEPENPVEPEEPLSVVSISITMDAFEYPNFSAEFTVDTKTQRIISFNSDTKYASYRWYLDGELQEGQTGSSIDLSNYTFTSPRIGITCEVTDESGSVLSLSGTLTYSTKTNS